MPVLDQTTSNSYTGNGVTTVFAYTFKLLDQADVLVEVDGVAKTLTTHYTVSGVGNSGGGNITFLSAPANAAEVVIQRDMAYLRETDYQDNGDLLAATLDEDIDRVVMQGQQTRDGVDRAAKLPVTVSGVDPTLPVPVANRGLKWNATADGFENGDSDLDAIEAAVAASAAAAAASQSAAASSQSSASASASSATASASTATTQAGIATTKAGEASASAAAALTSENNAETAETNAAASLADALAIYGSIVAVQSAASDAAASASAAQTAETNAETAETNAAASAAAAAASETAADSAYSSSIAIYGSLAAVQSAASSASASAVTAAAEADEATNQAASAAASALSAASVVSQDLSAIDRTVFAATIVDTFLYDTEKDSDGGAWRHRCGHTSWEAETLSGNWLGSAANETAARAISGATTGSYYYDTTAAGFYTLNAGSGKTATYRGNVRKFPAKVLITGEYPSTRIVLWDLTQAGAPMWMVFYRADTSEFLRFSFEPSLGMLNGMLAVGGGVSGAQDYYGCLRTADFASDRMRQWGGGGGYSYNYTSLVGIASRNTSAVNFQPVVNQAARVAPGLVDARISDIAMTVLPNAPVDVATGLPIPVIDVFTDAGTSRINSDGTVSDLVDTAGDDHKAGCILASGDSVALNSTNGNVDIYKLSNTLADTLTPDRTYDQATVPALLEAVDAGDKVVAMKHRLAIGQDNGVNVLIENPSSVAAGMVAYMNKDYSSGWMVGDIRGAWLADTTAETITGTELVTNGTFTTDATGWTATNATISVSAGRLLVTNTASYGSADQGFTTVVGKKYTASYSYDLNSSSTRSVLGVGTSVSDARNGGIGSNVQTASTGVCAVTFTATATTTYIACGLDAGAATTQLIDNISCRLADVDRSVKAKGLQVFGSITKAAVASGAALMGYSGFSAANYLEQPYNSDLDFGTGDFCIMGWSTPTTGDQTIVYRGSDIASSSPTDGFAIFWASTASENYLKIRADSVTVAEVQLLLSRLNHFIVVTRVSGVIYVYVDGLLKYSIAFANDITNATAFTRFGSGHYTATGHTLALWRITATVPSAEQIRHIYETEKPLFEANAQCCLAGTSNAVTALAYDEETDLLHVGTSYGRSAFKGLVRVSSEATPVGAITALAASAGVVVQGGASGADVYVPAYTLREELLRDAEQMAKFGQNLVPHDFTATASQTTFTLPVGWEIVAVYQQGAIKRETTSWTRSFDGFKWSVVLGTGATVSDWISILAKRV